MSKALLILIIPFLFTQLYAQDFVPLTLTLKPASTSSGISMMDTVYLKSSKSEVKKIYTKVSAADSVFKLSNVPVGKYYINLIAEGFCMSWLEVSVCSKCDNEFQYWAHLKKPDDDPCFFTTVNELPRYKGGDISLAKDFQNTLSKSDLRQLKKAADFSVSFFVTKNKEVSDIMFTPDNLPPKIKSIVTKGILKTTKWEIARQNGKSIDELFTVDKQILVN